jgi:hypothetical protein
MINNSEVKGIYRSFECSEGQGRYIYRRKARKMLKKVGGTATCPLRGGELLFCIFFPLMRRKIEILTFCYFFPE